MSEFLYSAWKKKKKNVAQAFQIWPTNLNIRGQKQAEHWAHLSAGESLGISQKETHTTV